jgi:hypothetical protein
MALCELDFIMFNRADNRNYRTTTGENRPCQILIKSAKQFIEHRKNGGHVVAYLVEAICYKPEGGGFHSR